MSADSDFGLVRPVAGMASSVVADAVGKDGKKRRKKKDERKKPSRKKPTDIDAVENEDGGIDFCA